MHYYKRHIGDYSKKAGRLTMLQHGSYTLLLDACYDRERNPSLVEAIDWCWASTKEEVEAVTFVLTKFFTLTDGYYSQKRIVEEIANYHANSATNKKIALNREETKRNANSTNRDETNTNLNGAFTESQKTAPNHKPLTNNQQPSNKYIPPIGAQLLADWLEVRKAKRSGKLTETAFKGLEREAASAGISAEQAVKICCERGWQSFKAEWHLKTQTGQIAQPIPARQKFAHEEPKKEFSVEQVAKNKIAVTEMAASFLRKTRGMQ